MEKKEIKGNIIKVPNWIIIQMQYVKVQKQMHCLQENLWKIRMKLEDKYYLTSRFLQSQNNHDSAVLA